jgi:hypothetical protein
VDVDLTLPELDLFVLAAACGCDRIFRRGLVEEIAMVRLGAAFGNGFLAETSAISAALRTSTPTGLPA